MTKKSKTPKATKTTEGDDKPDRILIKRYGNRRLYNTETSGYLNYQELVKLIRDGHDVQVIDSRTKADVTKAVLMQVILEEEKTQSVLYELVEEDRTKHSFGDDDREAIVREVRRDPR